MRRNLLREQLESERVLIGANPSFPSPEVVEFCGHVGFDWIFIDAEHGGVGVETCYSLVRAADAVGLASVVRVPINAPSPILSYAETGAHGLIVPHVKSAEDAEQLVRSARYWPRGNRGFFPLSRAANFGVTQTAKEWAEARESQPVTIAMIEDVEALEALSEIMHVEGIDAFFIGPADLAMSMGIPGGANDPRLQATVREAVQQLRLGGKTVGTTFVDATAGRLAADLGIRLLSTSVSGILAGAARGVLAAMREGQET
jgi:4-hydroxy-2-oxoheptanedioate aldolase